MENLEERRKKTEECSVEIVSDEKVRKEVNVSGIVINANPKDRNNQMPTGRSSIDATNAVTIGKEGTFAIDVHGPQKLESTITTAEQRAQEAAEKKRIADMPSPREDADDAR